MNQPLLAVNNLTHLYAPDKGFRDVSFELWPGEVLGIVGESGSGKTTLLKAISARLTPQQGEVLYQQRSLYAMSEAERRRLLRTEWGVVHQHPMDGLRRQVSAGGNIGERLMATGGATTATFAPPPKSGCRRWRSRPRASTTCPPPSPAACSSVCRSPAIWSPSRSWCLWMNPPAGWMCPCRRGC